MIKVTKFGGSSVADANQFKKVKEILEKDKSRIAAVISAAGKSKAFAYKMTDLFYLCHAHITYGVSCEHILNMIEDRFVEIRDTLSIEYDVKKDFDDFKKKINKDISLDYLVSRGEYFTSKLMASFLGWHFVDAAECIFSNYDLTFNSKLIADAVQSALKKYNRIVIPGFYSSLPNGKLKLMKRGGSDITGSLVSAACDADVYENWTDVSGILMADPRIVENPKSIPIITYTELQELASMGASVLHEDSIAPVREKKIPLNIRNTNKPDDSGTMIVDRVDLNEKDLNKKSKKHFINGITGKKNFSILSILKRNIDNKTDLVKVLEILGHYSISIQNITLGLNSFSFVYNNSSSDDIYNMISDIQREVKADDINIQENIALVAVVSHSMNSKPGISALIFQALGNANINIRTINQSADEISIVVGVDNSEFEKAIRVLYESFLG